MKWRSLIYSLLIVFSTKALALEGVYKVIIQKQEEKNSYRWSLADWMLSKKKYALMDQWLALHSSSTWFEFILDGDFGKLDHRVSDSVENSFERYGFAMYVRAIGIEGKREKFSSDRDFWSYQANLILLGSSAQSSNIILHYGKRELQWTSYGEFGQEFYGSTANLYLFRFLGGFISYRKYLSASNETIDTKTFGERIEYGGFIEISFLRLKATLFKERNVFYQTPNFSRQKDEGWIFGASLFF